MSTKLQKSNPFDETVPLMVTIFSFLFRMVAGHSSSQLWSARQFTHRGGKFALFFNLHCNFFFISLCIVSSYLYENKGLTYLLPNKWFFHIQEDWRVALKEVQPSAKREGFATGTYIFLTVSRIRMRDPVPFWPWIWDPGKVFSGTQIPNPYFW